MFTKVKSSCEANLLSEPSNGTLSRQNAWFAVQVRSRLEKAVSIALRYKGYDEFLPTYRSHKNLRGRTEEIERPLFPGYVFCRIKSNATGLVITTPGVIKIVGSGGSPTAIESAEIEALQLIGKTLARSRPCRFLKVGQIVRINNGPLIGLIGLLVEVRNVRRLVVSIDLLERSVAVEISRYDVVVISDTPRYSSVTLGGAVQTLSNV